MSTDILSKIVARKKEEIADAIVDMPINELRARAEAMIGEQRGFYQRLANPGPSGVNIIAEIKRASPSKGVISPDLDVAKYAAQYGEGGAACMSVLTDRDFFQGGFEDFIEAREAADLPMIRKDFLIDDYQIYESAAIGADAVLLIVRILEPPELKDLLQLAGELGMDALVEIHSEAELDIATEAGAKLIGVNNRNLKSFETNIDHSANMASRFAEGQVAVAESGIHSRADVVKLQDAGIFNFLIGESIVRSGDPVRFIRELMGETA